MRETECVCRKYWFEGYRPKPQGGTNFSRRTNNVLHAYDHKTESLMKNGGQQKCLDKALGDKKGENFAYVLNE